MSERAHPVLYFLDCALDRANAQLRRGDALISLRPKSFGVLAHLAERPGQLVTKDELLAAVWPDTAVTDWVLSGCVRELRQALDDDSRQPRMIETAHRRGYRFIAAVSESQAVEAAVASAAQPPSECRLVGRGAEIAELHGWLREAVAQRRQIGFVAGEPGIGKTALIDELVRQLTAPASSPTPDDRPSLWIGRGQCVDQHGAGEPYLPVFEALGRLCNNPDGAPLVALLRRHAPSWLVQLPGTIEADEVGALERRLGTNPPPMLREMAALVEALPQPLVLILEDLHWSDHATLHLLSTLAQRRDAARLLLIGTYRPVDVALEDHQLKTVHQELRLHGHCRDLWLRPLDDAAVAEYLRRRWGELHGIDALAHAVQQHTDGNPLFLITVADALVADGAIALSGDRWVSRTDVAALDLGVPHGLRQMIAARNARLSEQEREVLSSASLAGRTFSAAIVAAALDRDVLAVEEQLADLAQRGDIVRAAGENAWPDGTVSGAYRFQHALYQTVIREHVPPALRQRLHGRIGERLAFAYRERPAELAAELALHFAAAGQPDRAVPHLEAAADRALRLGAGQEAVALLRRGIALLEALPTSPQRTGHLIQMWIALGRGLPSAHGYNRPEIEEAFQRARQLSEQAHDTLSLLHALSGLATFHITQAQFDRAAAAADGIAAFSEELRDPLLAFASDFFRGIVRFHAGPLADARRHLDAALALGDVPFPAFSMDPRIALLASLGLTLAHEGHVEQARRRLGEARDRATAGGRPFDRASVLQAECLLAMLLRDHAALARLADEARALDDASGFGLVAAGVCLAHDGDPTAGLAMMRSGIEAYRAAGYVLWLPFLLTSLAGAMADHDQLDAVQPVIAEARTVVAATGEERAAAELQRIEGVVLLRRGEIDAAVERFSRAVDVAREQGARWWELRAATSLARAILDGGRPSIDRRVARTALLQILDACSEGADTADGREANLIVEQFREPRGSRVGKRV